VCPDEQCAARREARRSSRAAHPGNIDVHTPPDPIEHRAVERPDDPGERMIVFNGGPFAGYGLALGDYGSTNART
jgi:hypothetical protein